MAKECEEQEGVDGAYDSTGALQQKRIYALIMTTMETVWLTGASVAASGPPRADKRTTPVSVSASRATDIAELVQMLRAQRSLSLDRVEDRDIHVYEHDGSAILRIDTRVCNLGDSGTEACPLLVVVAKEGTVGIVLGVPI